MPGHMDQVPRAGNERHEAHRTRDGAFEVR
jgi:hypothetical protein